VNFLVLKHAACEGLGLWEECCRDQGIALEVITLHRGALLPLPHQFHAVICLGGPMSLRHEEASPFLEIECAFIRQAVAEGIPFLGTGLGGRLLARALGGCITRNGTNEFGWRTIVLDLPGQRDPLFAGLPDCFPVFQWDGDTFSVPSGAVRLASSEACQIEAFRFGFGGIAYGLQFRLEMTPSMAEEWVRGPDGGFGSLPDAANPTQMLWESPIRHEEISPLSRRLFMNFCRMVQVRFAGVGAALPPPSPQPVRRRSAKDLSVEEARQRYRELMAKGKLRCGITCPLDRIGQCTGGCW
jgi:GMP synthase-like glutamine amidotransferase